MTTYTHYTFVDRFRSFAHEHDDIPAFHAAFLVWTFLAAAVLNIGFFGILIVIHACLDVVKYRDLEGWSWAKTMRGVVLESLTDITLFFVALASAIYLHHSFALSILAGLSRAELTLARGMAMIFSKMYILEHFLHVFTHFHAYLHTPHPSFHKKRFSMTQKICLLFLCVSIMLLVISPAVFVASREQLLTLFTEELIPWHI